MCDKNKMESCWATPTCCWDYSSSTCKDKGQCGGWGKCLSQTQKVGDEPNCQIGGVLPVRLVTTEGQKSFITKFGAVLAISSMVGLLIIVACMIVIAYKTK